MDRLKSRAAEIEIRINSELFGEARVIACTLVGSAHHLLEGMKFGTLFIDEAAQALEAACWIPMKRASRVILAGDHCQLPPTVKSIAALRAGLGKTLMERIAENKPEVVTLLKIQYRMNDEIMRFSSDWFYGGKVESAPQIKYRSVLDYDHPITWIDTSNEENQITIEGEDAPRGFCICLICSFCSQSEFRFELQGAVCGREFRAYQQGGSRTYPAHPGGILHQDRQTARFGGKNRCRHHSLTVPRYISQETHQEV